MKKRLFIVIGFLAVAITIIFSLCLFLFTYDNFLNKYYEAVAYIIYSDYIRFKGNLGYFYVVWFILLRIIPPVFCIYYLIKKTREWLSGKENFVKTNLKDIHKRLSQRNVYLRLFHVSVIILVLFFAEKHLRGLGYYPGCYYTSYHPVDSLESRDFLYSDSGGMIRMDRNSRFVPVFFGHVNREGFRSKYEYDSSSISRLKKQGKKLIMFIGDSYTEGGSALPRDSCFVELIDDNPDYCSLNFGVGSTDPLQYKLVAERYVPLIKPDAVVIQTYTNDILQYERLPAPGIPMFYFTNASPNGECWESQKPLELGFKPNDVLKTKEEAYRFYKQFSMMPRDNYWQKLCSKSVITTKMWQVFNPTVNAFPVHVYKDGLPYAYNNLKAIRHLSDSLHTPVLFFHILFVADYLKPHQEMVAKYTRSFKDLPVHYIQGITLDDHVGTQGDTHFNNRGHAKAASLLTALLDSTFSHRK